MASVLVTDGQERAALAAVRSLGRSGHAAHVVSPRSRSLAGASRYARSDARVPDPLYDQTGFVAAVREIVRRRHVEVLLPISEASLLAVLRQRDYFDGVCIPFPSYETVAHACDKVAVLETARTLGIRIPRHHLLTTPAGLGELDAVGIDFPVVVKPSRSVAREDGRWMKLKVGYAHTLTSLRSVLDRLPLSAYPVLLQHRIVGTGIGVFLLLREGELLGSFAHQRLREKPPSGGVSVYRKSIPPDPKLIERSQTLLCKLGWHGVAMVEYKVDRHSGTPYLMEINPRFWGSLQLAIDAGVDFPALLVTAALQRPVQAVRAYRPGVHSRWWWGDVDHLLARLRFSNHELALPDDAPGRWRALLDFLFAFRPKSREEILRLQDPMPFVRETIEWFQGR
jgi:predicted ATP-grasp superfamily ATP-dependent carboligase